MGRKNSKRKKQKTQNKSYPIRAEGTQKCQTVNLLSPGPHWTPEQASFSISIGMEVEVEQIPPVRIELWFQEFHQLILIN